MAREVETVREQIEQMERSFNENLLSNNKILKEMLETQEETPPQQ